MTTYDTAQHQGDRVASTVKEEAQTVAEEAKRQTANLIDQAREEVQQQTVTQRDRLVDTLRGFTDDVERMLDGQGAGDGLAADLARQAADRARDLTSSLQDRDPGAILDDVRGFARRRPGTFLLGALAAGVVVGRLTRGARDDGTSGLSGSSGTAEAGPTNGGRSATAYADPTGGVAGTEAGVGAGTGVSSGWPTDTPLAPDSGVLPTDPPGVVPARNPDGSPAR